MGNNLKTYHNLAINLSRELNIDIEFANKIFEDIFLYRENTFIQYSYNGFLRDKEEAVLRALDKAIYLRGGYLAIRVGYRNLYHRDHRKETFIVYNKHFLETLKKSVHIWGATPVNLSDYTIGLFEEYSDDGIPLNYSDYLFSDLISNNSINRLKRDRKINAINVVNILSNEFLAIMTDVLNQVRNKIPYFHIFVMIKTIVPYHLRKNGLGYFANFIVDNHRRSYNIILDDRKGIEVKADKVLGVYPYVVTRSLI